MTLARQAVGADDLRPVYNNHASNTLAAHVAVKLDSGEDNVVLPGADTDHLLGVLPAAIPPKTWGYVQIRGKAKVLSSAALATPGVLLKATTAGKAVAWAAAGGANAHVLGTLQTTAGDADELVEVELAGPGVIKQG